MSFPGGASYGVKKLYRSHCENLSHIDCPNISNLVCCAQQIAAGILSGLLDSKKLA